MTYCLEANVRFGFVTGPVIDTWGRVVGVVGFDMSPAEGGDLYVRSGHPLVYQIDLFSKYLSNPPSGTGESQADDSAWLGVFTQPLTDDFATYWNLEPKGGLIVSTVVPGSPAQQAGLIEGDVIVSFDGTPIRARQDRDVMGFTKLVRDAGAGKTASLRVLRQGAPVDLTVTLGERPRSAQDAAEHEDDTLGLTVRELTQDIRIRLNLSEEVQGVIVRRVKSGSPAQLGKMQAGVIVLKIGEFAIKNLDDYKAALAAMKEQKPREVSVFARFGSETGFFRLEPVWE
jgi:serine protease Do